MTDQVEDDNGNWPLLEEHPLDHSEGMTQDMIYCLGHDNPHYTEPINIGTYEATSQDNKSPNPVRKKVRFAKTPHQEHKATITRGHRTKNLGQVMPTSYERVNRKGRTKEYMGQSTPSPPANPEKNMGHILIQNSYDTEKAPTDAMGQTIWEGRVIKSRQ